MSSYCTAVMSCQAERHTGQQHRADGQTEWAERTDGPDVCTERGLRQAARQTDKNRQVVCTSVCLASNVPLELWNTCGESWDDATF